MKKIRSIILVIIVFGSLFYFGDNEYFLLIGALLMYTGIIASYFRTRRNIRIGKYISVGKNGSNKVMTILGVALGLLLIIWGMLSKDERHEIFGNGSIVFTGVLFVILGLIRPQKSLFLLTDKTIQFEDVIFNTEWEYDKLDKAVIREKEIQFVKGIESKKFEIEDGDKVTKTIQDFLLPKLGNRLIIE